MTKPTKLSEAVAFIDRELRNSYRDKPDDDWCLICGENQPKDRPHLESCQWRIITSELAAKDAEIASWRVQVEAAGDLLEKQREEIARLQGVVKAREKTKGNQSCDD